MLQNIKSSAVAGITAIALSTVVIITMAELRTDGYDHMHKAVSELGSVDAPRKWIFNVFGYIIPGILIAYFAHGLNHHFRNISRRKYPFNILMLSGLFLSLAGIFPGDLDRKESLTTTVHLVGSLGGGICWLLSACTLWWQLKRDAEWNLIAYISFATPFVTVVLMALVPENVPGLAQRIAFAGNYAYVLMLSVKLFRQASNCQNKKQRPGDYTPGHMS